MPATPLLACWSFFSQKNVSSPLNCLTKGGDLCLIVFNFINHSFVGPRVIVFILGGITPSEMRVAYELMMQTKSEIIIGGTSLLTPQSFIHGLGGLV